MVEKPEKAHIAEVEVFDQQRDMASATDVLILEEGGFIKGTSPSQFIVRM